MKNLSSLAVGLIALLVASSPASAVGSASRTFVSATPPGTDTGNCPTTAPCRTFAYALTQTASSGEIIVLTSGGYGTVTINQPVSIINTSSFAGVTVAGGNGITINAQFGSVMLRGLTVDGGGSGSNGIVFNSGHNLRIDQCNVLNFVGASTITNSGSVTGNGILIQPMAGNLDVVITDTTTSNNAYAGVNYLPPSGSTASTGFVIDRVTATDNIFGIYLNNENSAAAATASVGNSVASENFVDAFFFGNFTASLDMAYASGNQGAGLHTHSGTVYVGRSVFMNNTDGIVTQGVLATTKTYNDNRIAGNGLDLNGPSPVSATLH